MPFNVLYLYSTHLLGIHKNCLFSSWSFLILWFSSKDSSPVLASGGTNLILSFSVGKQKYCYLRGSIESECWSLLRKLKIGEPKTEFKLSQFR